MQCQYLKVTSSHCPERPVVSSTRLPSERTAPLTAFLPTLTVAFLASAGTGMRTVVLPSTRTL